MTFPMMPTPTPAPFRKGALIHRSSSMGLVDIGEASEDRCVIVGALVGSGGTIGAFSPATLNGVAMTKIVEDYSYLGDDGQRTAFWGMMVPTGNTVTVATPSGGGRFVVTLTGIRDPLTSFKLGGTSASITNPVPSCAVGVWMCNFGSVSSIANMVAAPGSAFGAGAGHAIDYKTTVSPTVYTTVGSSIAVLRIVSWAFDY